MKRTAIVTERTLENLCSSTTIEPRKEGVGMDAGVEATQERLPDALAKSPAPTHGLAGLEPGKRTAG